MRHQMNLDQRSRRSARRCRMFSVQPVDPTDESEESQRRNQNETRQFGRGPGIGPLDGNTRRRRTRDPRLQRLQVRTQRHHIVLTTTPTRTGRGAFGGAVLPMVTPRKVEINAASRAGSPELPAISTRSTTRAPLIQTLRAAR